MNAHAFPTTWRGLEDIVLSEISQREKDKCYAVSHWEIKTKTELRSHLWVVPRGWVWGVGCGKWVKRVKRYEHPVTK